MDRELKYIKITMSTPKSEKDLHLPLSRVKTIMKSSPDVEAVGPEPLYLVTKVTVSFTGTLTTLIRYLNNFNIAEYFSITAEHHIIFAVVSYIL